MSVVTRTASLSPNFKCRYLTDILIEKQELCEDELEAKTLRLAIQSLKEKGVIMYSTCSLSNKENTEICRRFLEKHKDFKDGGMVTLCPDENRSDGFFYATLIRE